MSATADMSAADSGLPATDTELSHPGLERAALEAQASRRPVWTADHPVGREERTKNRLALRHLEGLTAAWRRDNPGGEFGCADAEDGPGRQDDGPLDRVL